MLSKAETEKIQKVHMKTNWKKITSTIVLTIKNMQLKFQAYLLIVFMSK